jgi:sugar (pentulose or hexulose) kinase
VKENGRVLELVQDSIPDNIRFLSGVPVVTGGADTQCGLLGMAAKNNEVGAVGGTTTPVQVMVEEPVLDSDKRTWTNNYLLKDSWIIESNVGYTGRVVRWVRDEFGCGKCYDELSKLAENISPGSNGLQSFLGPHLFNSGPPFWDVDKTGDLPVEPTITGSHGFSLSCLVRSIFEANSYGVKMNIEQLERVTRKKFNCLKFCGGNSKSDLWMQIQADILGIPILVPQVNDATAVGAALLAAKGIGYYRDLSESIDKMVRWGKYFEPRVETSKAYIKFYEKWTETRQKISRL